VKSVPVLQDMLTSVKSKDAEAELPVSLESLHDLQLNAFITSDERGALYTAEIKQHQPGI